MRIGRNNERVFNAAHDTVVQRELVTGWGEQSEIAPDELLAVTTGRLRLEALLAETLVLTDSQVLDGAVVLLLAERGDLRHLVRRVDGPVCIEVRARATALQASLSAIYARRGPITFRPSAFADGGSVSRALSTMPPASGSGVRGVVDLLSAAGVDRGELDRAEAGWNKVFELEASGLLDVQPWAGSLGEQFARSHARWPISQLRSDILRTRQGRTLADRVVAAGSNRSEVHRFCQDAAAAGSSDEAFGTDVAWVLMWYDELYRRASAFQHKADYRGSDHGLFDPMRVRQIFERDNGDHLVDVRLPAGSLTYLGRLSVPGWTDFQERHAGHLRKWWDLGDVDALRRVMDGVVAATQSAGFEVEPDRRHGQFLNVFGGRGAVSLVAKVGAAVGSMSLDPTPTGFSVAAALVVLQSGVEWMCTRSARSGVVHVTSYRDDRGAG